MNAPSPSRRSLLSGLIAACLMFSLGGLAGCGFQLYGLNNGAGAKADFAEVHLSADGPSEQLMSAVHLAIGTRNQQAASAMETSAYSLSLSSYEFARSIDNLTPAGIAIEYQLRASASYELTATASGKVLATGRPSVTATSTRVIDNPVTSQRKNESIERTLRFELATIILVQVEDKLTP